MVTTCATCHPPAPGPHRLHEAHVGVRWDDQIRGRWVIVLDGDDVTDRCIEALACVGDHPRSTHHRGVVTIACRPFSPSGHPRTPVSVFRPSPRAPGPAEPNLTECDGNGR